MFENIKSNKVIAAAIIVIFLSSWIQISALNNLCAATDLNQTADSNQEITVTPNNDGSYNITYRPESFEGSDAAMGLYNTLYWWGRQPYSSYIGIGFLGSMLLNSQGRWQLPCNNYLQLLRFNLAGFPNYATNVELRMYGTGLVDSSISAYNVTRSWKAEQYYAPSPTYSKYDGLVSSALSHKPIASFPPAVTGGGGLETVGADGTSSYIFSAKWYSWNITNLYNDWKSGKTPNNGVLLVRDHGEENSDEPYPHRFIGAHPELVITYTPKICIDPGHGTLVDSESQSREHLIADNVGQIVAAKLHTDNLNVLYTYPGWNVDERAAFVNNFKPDLLVSLHCNAAGGTLPNGNPRPNDDTLGKEIYVSEWAGDLNNQFFYKEPVAQTILENELATRVICSLQASTQQNEHYTSTIRKGNEINEYPIPKRYNDNSIFNNHQHRIAQLLHTTVCPAVLLEMEYKDYIKPVRYGDIGYQNMYDLLEHSYLWRADAAEGIYSGIKNYLNWYLFDGGIQEVHRKGMAIRTFCPVDIEVTDPSGAVFSKQLNEISDAIYDEGSNGDTIYLPEADGYQIRVIPEDEALPTDTFTLEVTKDGITTILAENVAIANIPTTPYSLSTEEKQVSFNQLGAGASPTVTYSIDGESTLSESVPFSVPVQSGQTITYEYQSVIPGSTGVQYALTSTTPTSPQRVDSNLEITGNYKTQYQVTVTTSDPSKGTVTPTASAFYDSGSSVQVSATPNIQYAFWKWSSTSSSVTFANEYLASTTATINGPATVSATFALLVSGNKHLTLTGSNNVIMITGGNNQIDATQATSTTVIKIGAGNNKINLGNGNNAVKSSADGNDQITTGNGDNNIYVSGNGNLQITTGNGNDVITLSGKGNNQIDAGNGNNQITVGNGNNKVTTGGGNDIVLAGNGNNNIQTGVGDDKITVGNGNNNVDGGAGNDVCLHGTGHNNVLNC